MAQVPMLKTMMLIMRTAKNHNACVDFKMVKIKREVMMLKTRSSLEATKQMQMKIKIIQTTEMMKLRMVMEAQQTKSHKHQMAQILTGRRNPCQM